MVVKVRKIKIKVPQITDGTKLLACPFCGGKAYIGLEQSATFWSVGCTKCQCDFPRRFSTRPVAFMFWNTRAII